MALALERAAQLLAAEPMGAALLRREAQAQGVRPQGGAA